MNQKTILIIMFPSYGHLNCTFAFADRLKREGYNIVYTVPQSLQKFIMEQGFEAITLHPELPSAVSAENTEVSSKVDVFLHKVADRLSNIKVQGITAIAKSFNKTIKELNPALILIDSFSPYPYFYMEGPKPPTVLLQIMLATKRRAGIPALNSPFLPSKRGGKFSNLKVQWSWWKYNIGKKWEQLNSLGDNNLQITYRAFKGQKKSIKDQLDFDYVFHPSIQGIPELILAPKSLDFNEISPIEQIYLASSMNVQRKDAAILDPKLQQLMDTLKATHQKKVWIFCSLGTLNISHNKGCWAFFKRVIEAFGLKKNWEIIIATGEMKPYQFGNQAANIHLFERVPQLEILPYCRAMITHGGINSTLECINHLTPMLVYPLNNEWDQNGNSARVVHYGLGLRGKLNTDKPRDILQKLEKLVETPIYLENLQSMRQQIESEDGLEDGIDLIKSMTSATQEVPDYKQIQHAEVMEVH